MMKAKSDQIINKCIPLAALRPHPRNYNQHDEAQIGDLRLSLQTFGQVRSIVVQTQGKNFLTVAGHGLVEAARLEGFEELRADVIPTKWDETRVLAYLAADNELARRGTPDEAQLARLVEDVERESGVRLAALAAGSEEQLKELQAGLAKQEQNDSNLGRLYNAGDGHDIEPFKLAYRVEAIYKARGKLALDLFSGQGQLAAWYRRRFKRVVTVDKNFGVGDVNYSMPALSFIENLLQKYLGFDFVDFDDEGCPHEEIKALFSCLVGKKKDSFVLALTDGQGLNLKCRGKFNPASYLLDEKQRKATQDDYEHFEEMVTGFIERCAAANGFIGTQLSSYRGRENNVVYQTWLINCAAESGADCDNPPAGSIVGLS